MNYFCLQPIILQVGQNASNSGQNFPIVWGKLAEKWKSCFKVEQISCRFLTMIGSWPHRYWTSKHFFHQKNCWKGSFHAWKQTSENFFKNSSESLVSTYSYLFLPLFFLAYYCNTVLRALHGFWSKSFFDTLFFPFLIDFYQYLELPSQSFVLFFFCECVQCTSVSSQVRM